VAKRSLQGLTFIPILAQALLEQTYLQKLYLETYEDVIAPVTDFHISNLSASVAHFPLQDLNDIIENDLCRWRQAVHDLEEYEASQRALCLRPSASWLVCRYNSAFANPHPSHGRNIIERAFEEANWDTRPPSPGYEPPTGRIIQAVANNDLPLVYMRFLNDQRGARVNLEVVYDIRLHPDLQHNQNPNLPDQMAVFHFHIDGFYDDYPAVVAFVVFHAQQTYTTTAAGITEDRADGHGTRGANALNRRTAVFSCANSPDPNARWYPGYRSAETEGFLIADLGETLRTQGVLRGSAFTGLWDARDGVFNWGPGERERANFLPDHRPVQTGGFTGNMDTRDDQPEPGDGVP
jgi:hypothetical protein